MKQFAKMVLAGFVGFAIYDACYDAIRAIERKIRKNKISRPESIYSPDKSDRRTIGFKMQGEE